MKFIGVLNLVFCLIFPLQGAFAKDKDKVDWSVLREASSIKGNESSQFNGRGPASVGPSKASRMRLNVQTSCHNDRGQIFAYGESGHEDCINEISSARQLTLTDPDVPVMFQLQLFR